MKLVLCGSHPSFSVLLPFLWIAMLYLGKEHVSLPCKILLTVLWATSSLQFLHPHHWHNVWLLNPLSWGRRDDCLKVLNLVSMEDTVKLSPWMRQLSLLFWCLYMVEHCHAGGGHHQLARFSYWEKLWLCWEIRMWSTEG